LLQLRASAIALPSAINSRWYSISIGGKVSKIPNDFMDQFRELEELYHSLLELRMRVRRAERSRAKPANRDPKGKDSKTARRNARSRKPAT
jgi:hypothetical protein